MYGSMIACLQPAAVSPAYLGRKPSFTREQFVRVRSMVGRQTAGIAQIAKETGLTRQTVYRIKKDPATAEAALAARGAVRPLAVCAPLHSN